MTNAVASKAEHFTVLVRGEAFTLTRDQIHVDAPNFFTAAFQSGFQEGDTRSVSLPNMHPRLFAIMFEYLCGYNVTPIQQSMLPETMNLESGVANLKKDAEFLQLDGFVAALERKFSANHEVTIRKILRAKGFKRIVDLETYKSEFASQKSPNIDVVLEETLVVAKDLRFHIEKGRYGRDSALNPRYGLAEISTLFRYTDDPRLDSLICVMVNGTKVPSRSWHNFCDWMIGGQQSNHRLAYDGLKQAWPTFADSCHESCDGTMAYDRYGYFEKYCAHIDEMVFSVDLNGLRFLIHSLTLTTVDQLQQEVDLQLLGNVEL